MTRTSVIYGVVERVLWLNELRYSSGQMYSNEHGPYVKMSLQLFVSCV